MIYFVESFPGGGKSYYSQKLHKSAEKRIIYYKEEYHNPLDLLRQAVMTRAEYKKLLSDIYELCSNEKEYRSIESRISEELTVLDDKVFIPFLHINTSNELVSNLLLNLYNYEYDDGLVSCKEYCDIILKRLNHFLVNYEQSSNYIFEGALFHNPLFTILGFYDMGKEEILGYYQSIYSMLCPYEYEIDLIKADDVKKAIFTTAQNRMSAGNLTWEKGFERWFKQTRNYSNLSGMEGIVSFAKEIIKYENLLLETIPFTNKIIERRI